MEYWAGFWGMLEVSTNLKLILWLSAISQACVSSKDTKIPKTGNIVALVVPRSSWDLCQSETHRQKSLLLIPLCQLCGWQSSLKHLKEQMWVRKRVFTWIKQADVDRTISWRKVFGRYWFQRLLLLMSMEQDETGPESLPYSFFPLHWSLPQLYSSTCYIGGVRAGKQKQKTHTTCHKTDLGQESRNKIL